MRKSTSINLELIKGEDGGVKFYAKQFDDLKLNIKVYDGLEEVNVDGQDIIVCIIKEDKTVIEQTKDITVEDNTIVARLSKQATTALGKCSMEVLLRDEEGTASTTTISYLVSEKLSASIVEMIKREDDINALNLIEEFIETSNVDMLDIKEAIKDLKATVDGAQDNIDAEYETILEALRALEGTIIENIEGKANEALTIADEAVEKATGAITKADEVLEKVEEAKGAVEDITTLKNEAVGAIGSIKTEAIDEVNNIKTRAIGDIDEAKTDSLEAIRNNGNGVANDLNALSDTLKADITNTGLLETNKVIRAREEALTEIDDLKDNAMGSLGEEALKVEELLNATVTEVKEQAETDLRASSRAITEESRENIGTIKDSAINEINGVKDDLGAYKDEVIEEAIRDKEEAINELNDAMRALNDLKANILSETNNDIGAIKVEAINNIGTIKDNANSELNENKAGAINELNEVKAGALVEINDLKAQVETILASINEKIVESNSNIEELSGLIEEAREVAGLVRAFIDSKAVDLSNYYTREETEALIGEVIAPLATKEELEARFKLVGAVGASPIPGCFMSRPEPPEDVIDEIWGYDNRLNRYFVVQYTAHNGNPYLYIKSSNCYINLSIKSSYNYAWSGTEWVQASTSTFYIENIESDYTKTIKNAVYKNIFYSTFNIYQNDTKTVILEPLPLPEVMFISDFNGAVEEGKYKVLQEDTVLDNSPITEKIDGIMNVIDVDDYTVQKIDDISGKTYIRALKMTGWTEWMEGSGTSDIDLSNYYTKEEIDEKNKSGKIQTASTSLEFDELPTNSFKDYPVNPDPEVYKWEMKCTHYGYHMIFYFREDPTGKIGVVEKTGGKLGFKLLDSSFTFDTYTGYYRKSTATSGNWSAFSNNNHFTNPDARDLTGLYYHNFNLVDGNNPDIVLKHGYLGSEGDLVGDFNEAIKYETYSVIVENNNILNSPIENINGILLNKVIGEKIYQNLISDDCTQEYKRIFNGTSWCGWR